jgi:hypothetical protein
VKVFLQLRKKSIFSKFEESENLPQAVPLVDRGGRGSER